MDDNRIKVDWKKKIVHTDVPCGIKLNFLCNYNGRGIGFSERRSSTTIFIITDSNATAFGTSNILPSVSQSHNSNQIFLPLNNSGLYSISPSPSNSSLTKSMQKFVTSNVPWTWKFTKLTSWTCTATSSDCRRNSSLTWAYNVSVAVSTELHSWESMLEPLSMADHKHWLTNQRTVTVVICPRRMKTCLIKAEFVRGLKWKKSRSKRKHDGSDLRTVMVALTGQKSTAKEPTYQGMPSVLFLHKK